MKAIQGIFITGTDTDVGKTVITAAMARALRRRGERVGIYKPACSGAQSNGAGRFWPDVEAHFAALDGAVPRERICPQCFAAPLAPPVAASAEGRVVDSDLFRSGLHWWRDRCDWLLVEGVGGFLCPLTEKATIADFAEELRWPVLVVARAGLGTINQTLLTLEAIQRRGLAILGVVLNDVVDSDDASRATNAAEIARRGGYPILAEIPHQPQRDLPHPDLALTMVPIDLAESIIDGAT